MAPSPLIVRYFTINISDSLFNGQGRAIPSAATLQAPRRMASLTVAADKVSVNRFVRPPDIQDNLLGCISNQPYWLRRKKTGDCGTMRASPATILMEPSITSATGLLTADLFLRGVIDEKRKHEIVENLC
jgi:hypothetical protein